jgi:hypothetical protein
VVVVVVGTLREKIGVYRGHWCRASGLVG